MSTAAITAIAPLTWTSSIAPAPSAIAGADFMHVVGQGVAKLNTDLNASDGMLRALAAGESVPVHDVMIAMEKARIDLQFAVEVRNRLLDGYQQLMRMQL